MLQKNIISKILLLSIEDDSGLWEIVWDLNSLPELKINISELIQIVISMYKEDLIKFYWHTWGSGDFVEISDGTVESIINKIEYWEPPSIGQVCITIASTDKGERFYFNNHSNP
jgi:hypothetical protein